MRGREPDSLDRELAEPVGLKGKEFPKITGSVNKLHKRATAASEQQREKGECVWVESHTSTGQK